MVKFNSVLSILLAIAVCYLLYDKFAPEEKPLVEIDEPIEQEGLPYAGKIAFVNIDSLNANFAFLDDKKAELDNEQSRAQRRMKNKMQKAQDRAMELQKSVQTMTEQQYYAAEAELQQLEVDMQKYQELLASELIQLETSMQTELNQRISDFLKSHNRELGYDYILGLQNGGQILYGQSALDITETTIDKLNAQYILEKDSL